MIHFRRRFNVCANSLKIDEQNINCRASCHTMYLSRRIMWNGSVAVATTTLMILGAMMFCNLDLEKQTRQLTNFDNADQFLHFAFTHILFLLIIVFVSFCTLCLHHSGRRRIILFVWAFVVQHVRWCKFDISDGPRKTFHDQRGGAD